MKYSYTNYRMIVLSCSPSFLYEYLFLSNFCFNNILFIIIKVKKSLLLFILLFFRVYSFLK